MFCINFLHSCHALYPPAIRLTTCPSATSLNRKWRLGGTVCPAPVKLTFSHVLDMESRAARIDDKPERGKSAVYERRAGPMGSAVSPMGPAAANVTERNARVAR